ncbi:MAG: hypothetical protein H7334_03915 [Ferruginibacter sp.]|nr:hypothetical protein [Ferruginibacter sp.]
MRKIYVLVALFFMPFFCFAQPSASNDYFRSASNGDWSSAATWQSSHDNVSYFAATLVPSSSASGIIIQNLHTVAITTSGVSMINTSVQNGGVLKLSSTAAYTIADGTGDDLMIENGGTLLLDFSLATKPAIPDGAGTALIKPGGKVVADAANNAASLNALAAIYAAAGSRFTYGDKSIFEWKIAGLILPSNNSAAYFKVANNTDLPIFRITTPPIVAFGSSSDNNLHCILEVNAPLNIAGSGVKTFTGGLRGISTITQTDGVIALPDAACVLDGTLTINTIGLGLRLVNGAVVPVGANVKITVPTENLSINKQNGNLQINGTLDITNCKLNNAGTLPNVTIASGGLLKTSNTAGFSGTGASIVSGTITLAATSTIEFNNAGNQNFESRADFKNVTFSGSGIKKPSSGFAPVGTIKITGTAILDCTGLNIGDGSTDANLTMDGGRLIVSAVSPLATQPAIGGAYLLTGGVVQFAGSAVTVQAIRSKTYQNIEVTGTNVGNSNSNITLNGLGTFVVKTGGTFTINDNSITGPTGTQTVTVESGATFNAGNNQGFNGYSATFSDNSSLHANIENIVLTDGSTIVYSRNGDQPITNANSLAYQNLSVAGTSGNKSAPSNTLTVQGNFTKSGNSSFIHNNGTVIFANALAMQDYSCISTLPVIFYNLVNSNMFTAGTGLNVLGNLLITNSLSLSGNSKLNLASGNITLVSTANNTARILPIPTSASIAYGVTAGRFAIERYYPNSNLVTHRAWRLVTVPLTETNSIYDGWQLGGAAYGTGNQHTGVLISGPQSAGNGIDYSPLNNYSLKQYDGINFTGIGNTHIPLSTAVGKGYFLFVRGDRNPALTNVANSDYTTLSSTGKIQSGSITIDAPYNFSLIGNPYVSPVDFASLGKLNINPHRFYAWDPMLNAVGGYVVMEDNANTGIFLPTAPFGGSSQDNYLQSSQAFFVERVAAGTASVTFKETDKASNYNPFIFKPQTPLGLAPELIRANIYLLNQDGSKSIADGCLTACGNTYSNDVNQEDALKFGNINESFCLLRHNVRLAVERRSAITASDTLYYQLTRVVRRSYQLSFICNLDSTGRAGFLEDSYTKLLTPIRLSGTTILNFNVDTAAGSSVPGRFKMVFKSVPVVKPFSFISVKANRQGNGIAVQWKVQNDVRILAYVIEQSTTNDRFETVQTILAKDSVSARSYFLLNGHALASTFYLRVKGIINNGSAVYSDTVKIDADGRESSMGVYPNPVTGGVINLQLINKPAGIYHARLLNSTGLVLYSQYVTHAGGSTIIPISVKQTILPRGAYTLEIVSQDKTIRSIQLEVL